MGVYEFHPLKESILLCSIKMNVGYDVDKSYCFSSVVDSILIVLGLNLSLIHISWKNSFRAETCSNILFTAACTDNQRV